MFTIKVVNATIAFASEIWMLFIFGNAGYHISPTPFTRYSLAISLPVLVANLWGIFAAPKSIKRLAHPYLFLFKLVLFITAAFVLYLQNNMRLAILFATVTVLNETMGLLLLKRAKAKSRGKSK